MKEDLKYLFSASFKDGTVIEQTPDDCSRVKPGGSAFTDVAEYEKAGNQLARFELRKVGANPADLAEAAVNLLDGTFERKGEKFQMHEEDLTRAGLRIVYFRNHTRHFAVGTGPQAGGQVGHEVVYRIGWQYTMRGNNYQRVMQID